MVSFTTLKKYDSIFVNWQLCKLLSSKGVDNLAQGLKIYNKNSWGSNIGRENCPTIKCLVLQGTVISYCSGSRSSSRELTGMLVVMSEEWELCYYLHSGGTICMTQVLCHHFVLFLGSTQPPLLLILTLPPVPTTPVSTAPYCVIPAYLWLPPLLCF